jgi:hypothetical protein
VDILAIQEHRIILSDKLEPLMQKGDDGYVFYLLSAEAPLATGGIGVVLSPRAANAVIKVQNIDGHNSNGGSRIFQMTLSLIPDRKLRVLVSYSPTAAVDPAIATQFYDQLSQVIAAQPSRDVTITLGDFNASIPKVPLRAPWPVGTANANASNLQDLMECHDQVSINSSFRKSLSKRATFCGPKERRVRLDHVLVHRKWRRIFIDANVLRPKLISSDHKLIWCRLRLREQLYKPKKADQVRFLWSELRKQEKRTKFEFEQEFESQLLLCEEEEMSYSSICHSIVAAAATCLPVLQPRRNPGLPWTRDEEVKKARDQWMREKLNGGRGQKQEEAYRMKMEELIQRETANIAKLDDNQRVRVAWQLLRKFTGKKMQTSSLQVEGETPEERNEEVRTFFSQLLSTPVTAPVPIAPIVLADLETLREQETGRKVFFTGPISTGEVIGAAWKIAPGKAPGPDGLPIDCFRLPLVASAVRRIMNNIMFGGKPAPDEWRTATIVPIPKKPSARTLDQHRGIALMNLAAKLFNRILLDRVRPLVDKWLLNEQNGFRRGRSTTQHILTLRRITEECIAHKLELHLIFIDFRKAFDSVSRAMLPSILKAYGIPEILQTGICSLYEGTTASVKTRDGITNLFKTESGVLQGDVLAPFLFTLYIDIALRTALREDDNGFVIERRRSSRHPAKYLSALAYADDLVVLSSSVNGAQIILTHLETACKNLGLTINTDKTKSLSLHSTSPISFSTSEGTIQSCTSFLYLGAILPSSEEDFLRRKGLAWGMMGKLRPLWQADLSTKARLRLFNAIVLPILSYAAETWTLNKSLEKRVDSAYMRLLRTALQISWKDHVSTKEVLKVTEVSSFTESLRERRRVIAGNVHGGKWSHLPHLSQVLLWCPGKHSGSVHSGKTTYLDMLHQDAAHQKVSWEQWLQPV